MPADRTRASDAEREQAVATTPAAPKRGPRFPGHYRFQAVWRGGVKPGDALVDVNERVVPMLRGHGYQVVERTADRIDFERRYRPAWTFIAAVFLFPVGLLALLVKGREHVSVDLLKRADETVVIAQGTAPLPVRQAFANLEG